MKKIHLAIPVLMAVVSGCTPTAFAPVERTAIDHYQDFYIHEKEVKLSVDEAMLASSNVLEEMGYQITTADPETGTVKTQVKFIGISADNCDCGRWAGQTVGGTAASVIKLDFTGKGNTQTSIKILNRCRVDFRGANKLGMTTVQEEYECASKGGIETKFWYMLKKQLASKTI